MKNMCLRYGITLNGKFRDVTLNEIKNYKEKNKAYLLVLFQQDSKQSFKKNRANLTFCKIFLPFVHFFYKYHKKKPFTPPINSGFRHKKTRSSERVSQSKD